MLAEIIPKVAAMDNEGEYEYYPRPSSAGPERCIRQMVYHGLRVPRVPMPGRARLVLDDSSWHEELTADWIRKTAFQIHSQQMEVKITGHTGLTIKGSIDGIVTDILGIDRLLEHKAINHFTFQRFWGGELPLDYITQCCLYIVGAREVNPNINEAILLIKNKNTAQYMEFRLSYDWTGGQCLVFERTHSTGERVEMTEIIPYVLRDAFDKFASVQDYIDRQTLPKRQYEIDHWRCEYCGWFGECYKNYQQEFQELRTDETLPDEMADMVRYYKECGAHESEMRKEKDGLKKKIVQFMKDRGAREGRAGEYVCRLTLSERKTINEEMIPAEILAAARVITPSERFSIIKAKGGVA